MSNDDDYGALRDRYTVCVWKSISPSAEASEKKSAEQEARTIVTRLRALATEIGRDAAEVDRLVEFERLKAEYYERTMALALQYKYEEAVDVQRTLAPKLEEFCLSSGHDLKSLTTFYRGVEAAVVEALPK